MDETQRWQQIRGYYEGFWGTWLLHVGRQLGLFQALLRRPGSSTAEIGQDLGYELPYVEVWCTAARAFSYLESTGENHWRVAPGWEAIVSDSGAWASTFIHLSNRVDESLEAVFQGRALPESSLNLRLHLAEGLKASYRWLWLDWLPRQPDLQEKIRQSCHLVEFGCGFGLGLELLRQHHAHLSLTGLEWDYDCAREAERVTRAVIVVGEPEDCSYSARFDVALFHRALALCREPRRALAQAVESLRAGGLLIVVSEAELPTGRADQLQTSRLRLGERFFYQMFHCQDALRSLSLEDIQATLVDLGLRPLHSEGAPVGGSPILVAIKAD